MKNNLILENLLKARSLLDQFLEDNNNIKSVYKAGDIMIESIKNGNKIIACGNGGSMSDAMHFAAELTGRFRKSRNALPAMAISDSSHITCTANDFGFEHIFSRFIEANGKQGDVLLVISTSANSPNIINAAISAKKKKIKIAGLTGNKGGKLASLCDVEIRAPFTEYSDRAQEIHITIIHCLVDYIESEIL